MNKQERRLELHEILLGFNDRKNVYFQPPESVKMEFPCIVYARRKIKSFYANNKVYGTKDTFSITTIDKNPDSPLPSKIMTLEGAYQETAFTRDNLNHTVFTIHY